MDIWRIPFKGSISSSICSCNVKLQICSMAGIILSACCCSSWAQPAGSFLSSCKEGKGSVLEQRNSTDPTADDNMLLFTPLFKEKSDHREKNVGFNFFEWNKNIYLNYTGYFWGFLCWEEETDLLCSLSGESWTSYPDSQKAFLFYWSSQVTSIPV